MGTDSEMNAAHAPDCCTYAFSAAGLQGNPVADTAPNAGQVLKWNGTG